MRKDRTPVRRRRRSTGLLLAGPLVLTAVTACSLGGADGGPDASSGEGEPGTRSGPTAYRMSVPCPPPPESGSVRVTVPQLNKVVARADLPLWQAGDIGAGAKLSDGRIAWVFGDTVRAAGSSPGMVANSLLLTSGLCLSQVLPPGDGPVVPDVAPGVVRWPMSMVVVPRAGADLLVVLTARIRRGSSADSWGFRYLGSDAALFTVRPGAAPQPAGIRALTPDSADTHQVNWGSAAMVSGRHLYVYGTRLPRGTAFGRSLHVGRAAVDDPGDRARWEFWDGRAWQPEPTRALAVLPAAGGVSQTLSVHPIDGHVVAVSKKDGDLGSRVATWTSSTPVGPWTRSLALDAPFLTGKDTYAYAPLAHPEVPLADGRLLVSISRNTTDLDRLRQNPVIGRPRFAEIDRP